MLDIESKYALWFKVSSKLVNLNEDVIFGNVYIPTEGSPYFQPDTFDQIENEIRTFSQNYKYISLCSLSIILTVIWEETRGKSIPFLFAMFLNDLQMFFENANLNGLETVSNCIEDKLNIYLKLFALLYADDTVLMAETHDDLQNILNKFGEYCNTWRLKANTDKTKVIVFARGRQSTNLKFTLNGSELEIVNEFNYLGILLTGQEILTKLLKSKPKKLQKQCLKF